MPAAKTTSRPTKLKKLLPKASVPEAPAAHDAPKIISKPVKFTIAVDPADTNLCHSSCSAFEYAGLTTVFCNAFNVDITGGRSSSSRCLACLALMGK